MISPEERQEHLEQAMEAHPDGYFTVEEDQDDRSGETWNPRLHLTMHAVILGYVQNNEEVRETYETLTNKHELHPHSAVHALQGALSGLVEGVVSEASRYDPEQHREQLEALTTPGTDLFDKFVESVPPDTPPDHPEVTDGRE